MLNGRTPFDTERRHRVSICVITGVEVQLPMLDLFMYDVRFEV